MLNVNNEVHELKLGRSFETGSRTAYHAIRYDFKPASVDKSQEATLEVGKNNEVTVKVPHVEGSGTSHTVYKGNKRPSQKECVLIIDHRTGEFRLEKLSNTVQLKKTRTEGSSKAQLVTSRPLTPNEMLKMSAKSSPSKKKPSQSSTHSSHVPVQHTQTSMKNEVPETLATDVEKDVSPLPEISDSDSSSGNSSSDSETEEPKAPSHQYSQGHVSKPYLHSTLSEDLRLSESGSDSD